MTGNPHNPDPLAPPHWLQEQLDEAYDAGIADAHRLHVLAWVLAVGLGIVIGFVIAGSVFATSRSGQQSVIAGESAESLADAAARSEAPSRLVFHVTTGQGGASPQIEAKGPQTFGVPPLAAPTKLSDEGGISSALSQGWATFCRPTATRCQSWGGGALLGAVPSFRYGDKPHTVVVWHGSHHVAVRVVSYCACGDRAGSPTVIDLSPAAFMRLAPLSEGVIEVTLEAGGPSVTVPPTDVSP